jgi:hypothetical protein
MFRSSHLCTAIITLAGVLFALGTVRSQPPKAPAPSAEDERAALGQALGFTEQLLARKIDEQMLFQALSEVAQCDKVRYTGPPPRVVKNPTAPGAKNPVIVPAYTFLPKKYLSGQKLPLIVFAHGGVHGSVGANNYANIFRELLNQGYAIIAPDYRGSSGYGRAFWELIDYGGLEIEDVFAGRQFMLEAHDNIDPDRVGIMGWSHGGLITLMNLFAHPRSSRWGTPGCPSAIWWPGWGTTTRATATCFPPRTTSARRSARTWTSTVAGPRRGTPRSSRRRSSSTRQPTTRTFTCWRSRT